MALLIAIILACFIIIGLTLRFGRSPPTPPWVDELVDLADTIEEIQKQGELGAQDRANLRRRLDAAKRAGIPEIVGRKLGEVIDGLCG